ncbi:hypothetical protein [Frigidibacter sp. MR17.24]|uniref:hypothetical protein n=1 Tax=Frigidibacter sp. MR17.24 TaxID=3127345 RepID=UPI003012FA1D
MAVAERIDYSEYHQPAMPAVATEAEADELFRRLARETSLPEDNSMPSGWWIIGLLPMGLLSWGAIFYWIFG